MNIFSAFSKPDSARLLFLGYPGKTAFLYFRKLGKVVATIPTIGFNVETFESPSGFKFTGWDIGGCDKIRPLVKHYYDGTDAVIFFIGTTNKAELDFTLEVAKDFILWHDLPEVPTVFFCVQRDLPAEKVLPELEVLELLSPLHGIVRNRPWAILFGSAMSNLGHDKVFQWLERQLSDASKPKSSKPLQKVLQDSSSEPSIMKDLQQSIPVSDSDHLDDTSFLEAVENYMLPSWDHKTHLRLAFLVLTKEGRQRAVSRIMELIKNFIDNSPRTSRGKTFHITMTYFWIQMVHYALATLPKHEENASPSFEYLLLKKPWLSGSGLYRFYYSDEVMLKDPASRLVFIPPDKKPLPNVL